MNRFISHFSLAHEKEDYEAVVGSVDRNIEFRGTNLWVLVFAIFIASLGLNVNSTAVVIGAMLVSPLMGPIMGLGLGMGINDLAMLRKALANLLLAVGIGLATSTIYFFLTPINDAQSELLARTSPNVYDVLIALFGGFAGILAMSSKQKGNVIPGVAIATALMPPLCTAGYGIANLNLRFVGGALYLFLINSVFIALATLLTVRTLKFPYKQLPDAESEVMTRRVVWAVVVVTLLPSIYFGYNVVQNNRFRRQADKFITHEAVFPNDFLLKKVIEPDKQLISLTYGGEYIEESVIEALRTKLPAYDLGAATLEIRQGFSYLNGNETRDDASIQLNQALAEREGEIRRLNERLGQIDAQKKLSAQVVSELRAQDANVVSGVIERSLRYSPEAEVQTWVALVDVAKRPEQAEIDTMKAWLKVRLQTESLDLIVQELPAKPTPTPASTPN